MSDELPININSLEVVYGLTKAIVMNQEFLDAYIHRWFMYCTELDQETQTRRIKVVARFVTELLQKRLFDPALAIERWYHFCNQFSQYKCMKDLQLLIANTLKAKSAN